MPVRDRFAAPSTRARPKSSTFTTPLGVLMTFSGLMSRWTTPAVWATANAFANCNPMSTTFSIGTGPDFTSRRNVSPGTYS